MTYGCSGGSAQTAAAAGGRGPQDGAVSAGAGDLRSSGVLCIWILGGLGAAQHGAGGGGADGRFLLVLGFVQVPQHPEPELELVRLQLAVPLFVGRRLVLVLFVAVAGERVPLGPRSLRQAEGHLLGPVLRPRPGGRGASPRPPAAAQRLVLHLQRHDLLGRGALRGGRLGHGHGGQHLVLAADEPGRRSAGRSLRHRAEQAVGVRGGVLRRHSEEDRMTGRTDGRIASCSWRR